MQARHNPSYGSSFPTPSPPQAFKPFELDSRKRSGANAPPLRRTEKYDWRVSIRDHMQRVGAMSTIVAEAMGLSLRDAELIGHAARVHDIGKMFVPPKLHEKAGALTPGETHIMRSHAMWGFDALKSTKDPLLVLAAQVALEHHERWDGSGYPFGLAGDEIGLPARIVAVCDVYDALRSRRSYKPSMSHRHAMSILIDGDERTAPTMFDPDVIEAFARSERLCCEVFDEPQCSASWSLGQQSN
jgi:putative two-component system response regulator